MKLDVEGWLAKKAPQNYARAKQNCPGPLPVFEKSIYCFAVLLGLLFAIVFLDVVYGSTMEEVESLLK